MRVLEPSACRTRIDPSLSVCFKHECLAAMSLMLVTGLIIKLQSVAAVKIRTVYLRLRSC
jgi:hypothetical protein